MDVAFALRLAAAIVLGAWVGYTIYRTGYRDGHSDGIEGQPPRRW